MIQFVCAVVRLGGVVGALILPAHLVMLARGNTSPDHTLGALLCGGFIVGAWRLWNVR